MRVLIVDDTAFMRMTLRNTLEKSGYEVIGEAENGEIGVSKYFELKPNVVTMDITMPVMDGIKAIKEIKQKDPAAKIIVVSAMGQKELVVEALQSGARDFIVKPFQPERVLEAIQKL
jgi:two-component system chemotaxis response regulator CheY